MAVSYDDIRKNEEILAFIHRGNANLRVLEFAYHSQAHIGITIVSAIAHHYESTGGATDAVSAALIIADKTEIDESVCTMYEYFDIFLQRMLLSRAAAEMLGAKF